MVGGRRLGFPVVAIGAGRCEGRGDSLFRVSWILEKSAMARASFCWRSARTAAMASLMLDTPMIWISVTIEVPL